MAPPFFQEMYYHFQLPTGQTAGMVTYLTFSHPPDNHFILANADLDQVHRTPVPPMITSNMAAALSVRYTLSQISAFLFAVVSSFPLQWEEGYLRILNSRFWALDIPILVCPHGIALLNVLIAFKLTDSLVPGSRLLSPSSMFFHSTFIQPQDQVPPFHETLLRLSALGSAWSPFPLRYAASLQCTFLRKNCIFRDLPFFIHSACILHQR